MYSLRPFTFWDVPKMTPYHKKFKKLSVKGAPKHILKLRNIHISNRRDKY